LCGQSSEGECDEQADRAGRVVASLSNYRWFFLVGQFVHGVGASPIITLGTTLLDENVSKKSSPLYIGIFQTFFVIGPALGFIVGSVSLSFYTDVDVLSTAEMTALPLDQQSPLWVGAWWVGFVLAFLMAWSCAALLSFFPAAIPGSHEHNQVREKE